MKNCLALGLSLALLVLTGCGDKVGLGGKVTFEDGSPLGVGTVCFETDTYLARGTLKPDGSYVVGSLSERDGLPAGTYRVYISGAEKEIGKDKEEMPIYESMIDEAMTSGATSGLSVTVPVSGGKYDIKVKPYEKKK